MELKWVGPEVNLECWAWQCMTQPTNWLVHFWLATIRKSFPIIIKTLSKQTAFQGPEQMLKVYWDAPTHHFIVLKTKSCANENLALLGCCLFFQCLKILWCGKCFRRDGFTFETYIRVVVCWLPQKHFVKQSNAIKTDFSTQFLQNKRVQNKSPSSESSNCEVREQDELGLVQSPK